MLQAFLEKSNVEWEKVNASSNSPGESTVCRQNWQLLPHFPSLKHRYVGKTNKIGLAAMPKMKVEAGGGANCWTKFMVKGQPHHP